MSLYELNQNWQEIFSMLENPEIDEQTIFDTLESIEGDIEIKAENCGKIIRMLQGEVELAENEVKRIQAHSVLMDNRIKRLKKSLQEVMQEIGRPKINTPLFSFYIQKNPPSLEIAEDFNIEDLPDEYAIPQPPKINKAKIKEDIKDGWEIPWATIKQTESLRMR